MAPRGIETRIAGVLGELGTGRQLRQLWMPRIGSSRRFWVGKPVAALTVDGILRVKSGDRIPLIPRNILKLSANYSVTERFNIDGDAISISSTCTRQ